MKKQLTVLFTTCALVGTLSLGLTLAQAQTTSPAPPTGAAQHERHPAIHRAIRSLEEAKPALERADHDFGGHRKDALEQCDKAIAQLKLALQYDKK